MERSKDIYINPETGCISVNRAIFLRPTVMFENEHFRVRTTGHEYDFIATVENLTEEPIRIKFVGETDWIETLVLKPNDWVGLLADTDGYSTLEALSNGRYEYAGEDDDD